MFAVLQRRAMPVLLAALAVFVGWVFLSFWPLRPAHARDLGGKYANSPLKSWFDQLASKKGLCCSFADGFSLADVDWDVDCATAAGIEQCRYRVRIDGEWMDVPDEAVITEPNRYGTAVVWPYKDASGTTQIRCFMPGAGA
jgi:hypothetical protein